MEELYSSLTDIDRTLIQINNSIDKIPEQMGLLIDPTYQKERLAALLLSGHLPMLMEKPDKEVKRYIQFAGQVAGMIMNPDILNRPPA